MDKSAMFWRHCVPVLRRVAARQLTFSRSKNFPKGDGLEFKPQYSRLWEVCLGNNWQNNLQYRLLRTQQNTSGPRRRNVRYWNTRDVVEWLHQLGLGHHSENFQTERVNGPLLLSGFDQQVLEELGILEKSEQICFFQELERLVLEAECELPEPGRLSPSAASRWLACPPSAALETQLPREESSVYAMEGTLAHELAATEIAYYIGKITEEERQKTALDIENRLSPGLIKASQDYVDFAKDYISTYAKSPGFICRVEETVSISSEEWANITGTPDLVLVYEKCLHVVDFKSGRHIDVPVEDNEQLMLYALAVYLELKDSQEIQDIKLSVVQPRCTDSSKESTTFPISDLKKWADNMKPKAQQASQGAGEFRVGRHCRFCAARMICRTRFLHQADAFANLLAQISDNAKPTLTTEDISVVLDEGAKVKRAIDDVTTWAARMAQQFDTEFPGFLLTPQVPKKSYADRAKIVALLENDFKYSPVQFLREDGSLITMTQLRGLIGRNRFNELIETGLIAESEPKYKLVSTK
eukprot:m.27585 g.27585  ORF g.27585 m.27585 type:complete len:527 (-) comp7910_c0_seq2:233-1813(-)